MRVVLLSPNARAADAIGRHVAETVACFLEGGAHVRVVTSDGGGLAPALWPYTIVTTKADTLGAGWRAARAADVVVVQFPQDYPLLDWLPLLADGRRRILFDYHGLTPAALTNGPPRAAVLRGQDLLGLAGFADGVVCHSRFAERELTDSVTLPADRRHRVGYCVDAGRLEPSGTGSVIRERLGLGDAKLALFVGRLAANKRVPVLIEALARSCGIDPPLHALIVGPCAGQFEPERLTCRETAADFGVADRVHFLGEVDEATLTACYREADVFVMPSVHEGFCFPVVEAMASGVPVVAARAGALPETVADAGLLFTPNDAADLARQVRRALDTASAVRPARRVAVVTPGFGACVGGAERSLSLMASVLADVGLDVTVFATRLDSEADLRLKVCRCDADPCDPMRRESAAAVIAGNPAAAGAEIETKYFQNTTRSVALVEAIRTAGPFDAVVVGPCVTGLTRDVVREFGESVVLVPCLHDEPLARTRAVREMFDRCGAVWFHSTDEQRIAASELGLAHPRSAVVGSWVDCETPADVERGRKLADSNQYVVYCGRFAKEKGLQKLCDFARRYGGNLRFVFIGAGDAVVPQEPWAVNLGRLSDADKRDVVAGALALVQLSANESLSLVVLEAQALGVPVVVNGENPVLANHARSGGGIAVTTFAEFASALDRLQQEPELVRRLGHAGRRYVEAAFGSKAALADRIVNALAMRTEKLPDRLRANGRQRADEFSRENWRTQWQRIVDRVLDRSPAVAPPAVRLRGAFDGQEVPAGGSVRIVIDHMGGAPLMPRGPGRTHLVLRGRAADGEIVGDEWTVCLPAVIAPGDTVAVDVVIPALMQAGVFDLEAGLFTFTESGAGKDWMGMVGTVRVVEGSQPIADVASRPRSTKLKAALSRAGAVQSLPESYVDVSTGVASRVKRWAKQKLLHNFRAGYVDVLSRQQTRFNREVLRALDELAAASAADGKLAAEVAELRRELDALKAARGFDRPAPRRVA